MIENITERLFSVAPESTLYHYTSLSGLLGIVNSGELRASDIRYMNDSAELRHTLDLLRSCITERVIGGADNPALLNQLLEWLSHRIVSGPMLFGASFRANGNLLSQWRGYSVHGKGVSLGFNPQHICACAERQDFQVGKCLYDPGAQRELIEQVVDALEATARQSQESAQPTRSRGRAWYSVFERVEGDLLRIAAILKHPSFEEEQEWRIVSPMIGRNDDSRIQFREGASMVVPYYAFDLSAERDRPMVLDHVFLGPTNNIDLSMNSLELLLDQRGVLPKQGISYCDIPYRQR